MIFRSLAALSSLSLLAFLLLAPDPPSARSQPVKFMCDMCESNFWHCMMKCHMEQYMTRHSYNSHQVYMGRPRVRPKKTHLDKMFEHFMHQTGHTHV